MNDRLGPTILERRALMTALRDGRASVSGVAQKLRLDTQEVLDCLRGRHCPVQDPYCAACRNVDPHYFCCICGEPVPS